MNHKHHYEWTGEFNFEGMCYEAVCNCGKRIFEVWEKSHYGDEKGTVLPDSVEDEFA